MILDSAFFAETTPLCHCEKSHFVRLRGNPQLNQICAKHPKLARFVVQKIGSKVQVSATALLRE
ncbi:hypothetical protein ACWIUD_05350 [Helicobacter sp. 23-1044]